MHSLNERYMNGIGCQGKATSVKMFKNKIWVCLDVGYEYNRTLDKLLCPVPSWVPNIIVTWGGLTEFN